MLVIHSETRRVYFLVGMLRSELHRAVNRNSPAFLPVTLTYSSRACQVCSVNSKRTGCPVFSAGSFPDRRRSR